MEQNRPHLADIRGAAERIAPYIRRTPLLRQGNLDEKLGCQVYLKPEMLQPVGAFKQRGALNAILLLSPEEREKGIITSSSGNHAQACAWAGQRLGMPVTVVIPEDAPQIKVDNARAMGARVILAHRDYYERWRLVAKECQEHGYVPVHPYEEPRVMAGQGTIGLEILSDLPEVDTVLVPVGGGGLISGVSTAIKETNPRVRVVGVQAAASPAYCRSREAGKRVSVEVEPTVADGLSCRQAGENPFPIIEEYVDELVEVSEGAILDAVRLIASQARLMAEPSAAVGIAALLEKAVAVRPEERVAVVLTAGNWDLSAMAQVLAGETPPATH